MVERYRKGELAQVVAVSAEGVLAAAARGAAGGEEVLHVLPGYRVAGAIRARRLIGSVDPFECLRQRGHPSRTSG